MNRNETPSGNRWADAATPQSLLLALTEAIADCQDATVSDLAHRLQRCLYSYSVVTVDSISLRRLVAALKITEYVPPDLPEIPL